MEWGISPSNFNNIVDLPLFTTNGLIVKQFNSIEDIARETDYFILDGNSLLRIDGFDLDINSIIKRLRYNHNDSNDLLEISKKNNFK